MSELLKGGEFLIREVSKDEVFTPEDLSSEQKQMMETTEQFIKNEVMPDVDAMDNSNHNFDLLVSHMKQAGELGLFSIYAPEEYDGLDLGLTTGACVVEKIAPAGSFSVAYAAHVGIGSLPLIYYGTKEQKEKYLPKLVSGEWIAAYCLTEPDAGTDALGMRAVAKLSDDGKYYILNGTKQFITNGSIADLYTVFAKTPEGEYVAFLVERNFEGVSVGREEDKMGIRGSSTAQIMFDNAKIPVENLLGKVGEGHKIAFQVLDEGRFVLGAAAVGAAKAALEDAVVYANDRKQFGMPLTKFGAIKEKIADMVSGIYSAESLAYRLAGLYDERVSTIDVGKDDPDYYKYYHKALEDYAVECSITKVYCSELLDKVADEVVQIYGGYGFIKEYPAERYYRDSRINRIFEGTNEINRYLVPGMLLKKGMKGELPLVQKAKEALDIMMTPSFEELDESVRFIKEKTLISNLKTMFLVLAGAAVQKYMDKIKNEQEVLFALADMAIGIFSMESAVLRADKVYDKVSDAKKKIFESAVKVATFNLNEDIAKAAKKAAYFVEEGDNLMAIISGIRRFTKYDASGLLQAKRELANYTIENAKYPF